MNDPVKVNPLEWEKYCSNAGNSSAKVFGSEYICERAGAKGNFGVWFPEDGPSDEPRAYFRSLKKAKAFAQADYTARILADLDLSGVEALQAEVERCHRRLEIDRVYIAAADSDEPIERVVPMDERATMPDGITCRDATIELQDERIAAMAAEVERLRDRLERGLAACDQFDGPVSRSQFVNGQATCAQQIRAAPKEADNA